VLQYAPSTEKACEELLGLVAEFLTKRYPDQFSIEQKKSKYKSVLNKNTSEHFSLEPKDEALHPLEACARLAMEDFNILIKDNFGEHRL